MLWQPGCACEPVQGGRCALPAFFSTMKQISGNSSVDDKSLLLNVCKTGPSATRAPGEMSADSALQPASDRELAPGLARIAWTSTARHMLPRWLLRKTYPADAPGAS